MTKPRWDRWTDEELTILYRYASTKLLPGVIDELCALLPDRTATTIHNRLSRLRSEAGIRLRGWTGTLCEEEKKIADASTRLADAIEREWRRGTR